jgi:PBP1b-binding outer membrane lipoprotein LpoB
MAMKNRTTIILVVVGVLLLSVLGFTYMGCSCKRLENFEDAKKESDEVVSTKPADLSAKEKELFENLKENKLSDDEINKLVKAKVLTEDLVEKFLEKLQTEEVTEGFTSVGPKYGCVRN